MRKFGIIGYPLSHSFSPTYFAEKFRRENIANCSYDAFPILQIEKLPAIIKDNPELEGLNVTIPYKKQIIPYLHNSTGAVQQMAACNCVRIKNGKLYGHNTDVVGFEKSFTPLLSSGHKALVLGTGGAAAAVEFVLKKLQIPFVLVSRKPTGR